MFQKLKGKAILWVLRGMTEKNTVHSKISVSILAHKIRQAIKESKNMDNKPGWKTTEFWLVVVGNIALLFSAVQGALDPEKAAVVSAVLIGIYNVLRSLMKQPSITTLSEIKK